MFENLYYDIKVAFDRDPAARNTLEVLFCYVACMQYGATG
jgi:serine acetyltransferase